MDETARSGKHDKAPHTAHGVAQQQALILAAFRVIAEEGFEGLRTRDVASRAGVNIATLHYYFATKEDLIQGVVDYLAHEFANAHLPYLTTQPHQPLDELRAEFTDARIQARQTPDTYIVLFELVLRSLRDPAIMRIMQAMDNHWRAHIATYLRDGVNVGVFRADLDIPTAAAGIVACVKGYIIQCMLHPDDFPAERVAEDIERWLRGEIQSDD